MAFKTKCRKVLIKHDGSAEICGEEATNSGILDVKSHSYRIDLCKKHFLELKRG